MGVIEDKEYRESYEYKLECAEADVKNAADSLASRTKHRDWLLTRKQVETQDLFTGFLLDFKIELGESRSDDIIGDGRSAPAYSDEVFSAAYFSMGDYFFTESQQDIVVKYVKSIYHVRIVQFVE